MNFASDNTAPVHPAVMDALRAANEGHVIGYGGDAGMAALEARLRALFEAPEAVVRLVPTGTAANALALATMVPPTHTIYCHRISHISVDECGAPEFYTGGAKLTLIDGADAKIAPDALEAAIAHRGFVHAVQPGALSITNLTERGSAYSVAEVEALARVARAHDLPVHMDGARFANALVSLDAGPAEMTWRAGVDAVSFGGTKNGLMGVEAVIYFDPAHAWNLELRRKRGGHLFSKHRYLAAQMAAYLEDGLWLDLARQANAMAARLAEGLEALGIAPSGPVDGNMMYVHLPQPVHEALQAAGAVYYAEAELRGVEARLVTSWNTREEDVDAFLAAAKA